MLFFGPADFSQGIGTPGNWNNPKLIKTRELIAKVAHKHGKFPANTGSIDKLDELIDMGYRFINIGADVVGLSNYFKNLTKRFNESKKTNQ